MKTGIRGRPLVLPRSGLDRPRRSRKPSVSGREQDGAKLAFECEQSALLEQRLQSGDLQPREIQNDFARWMYLRSAPLGDQTPVQFVVEKVRGGLEFATRKATSRARSLDAGGPEDFDPVEQVQAPLDYDSGCLSEIPTSQIDIEKVAFAVFDQLQKKLLSQRVANLRGYLYRGGWRAGWQALKRAQRRVWTPEKLKHWRRRQELTQAKRTHDADLDAFREGSLELRMSGIENPTPDFVQQAKEEVDEACFQLICRDLDPSLRAVYRLHYLDGRGASDIVRDYALLAAGEPGSRSRGRAVTAGTIRNYLTRARSQAQPALQRALADLRSKLLGS